MKVLTHLFAAGFIAFAASVAHPARAQATLVSTDLIAGQNLDVGDVLVTHDSGNLYVQFTITELGWGITETHLEVGPTVADIPQTRNGNPIPGQFSFQDNFDFERTVLYTIPLTALPPVENLVIAAHAVVSQGNPIDFCSLLPSTVTLRAYTDSTFSYLVPQTVPGAEPLPDPVSFWDAIILDTDMQGIYEGWCLRSQISLATYGLRNSVFNDYQTDVFCPASLPQGVVAYPENLGLVEYLINQINAQALLGGATIKQSDVQGVIWTLVDAESTVTLSATGEAILEDVLLNGPGFQPTCGQLALVVLVPWKPQGDMGQPIVIGVPVTCEAECKSETAWANGFGFCGRNWATYFTYSLVGNQPAADALAVDCDNVDKDKCDDDRGPKKGKDWDDCDDDRSPKGGKDGDDCEKDRGPKDGKDWKKQEKDRGSKGGKDRDDCDEDRAPKGDKDGGSKGKDSDKQQDSSKKDDDCGDDGKDSKGLKSLLKNSFNIKKRG